MQHLNKSIELAYRISFLNTVTLHLNKSIELAYQISFLNTVTLHLLEDLKLAESISTIIIWSCEILRYSSQVQIVRKILVTV